MERENAISYLEKLKRGDFLTVNIPIMGDDVAEVTAMYIGKDKQGRYNFLDSGELKLTKDFIERGTVTLDENFDEKTAMKIKNRYNMRQRKNKNISIR